MATQSSSPLTSANHEVSNQDLVKENQKLQRINSELRVQIAELQSDSTTKDDVIGSLELELKSVLRLSTSSDSHSKSHVNPTQNGLSSSHQIEPNTMQKSNQKPTTTQSDQSKRSMNTDRGVIGIVGAMQIGSQLAALLALKGYIVVLIEARKTMVEKSKVIWKQILESYFQQKRASKDEMERASKSISYIVSVAEMKSHGDSMRIVIDTARDDHKREVLQQIMKFVDPKCMVISHSPTQCITKRSSFVAPDRRQNLIGMNLLHFGVSLVDNKAIEIVPSWQTSSGIVDQCKEFVVHDLDRRCIVIRDAAALVSNRLLAVYLNEAFHILERGLCSAEEMDNVMDLVMNKKIGPFRMADKIGLNVVRDILEGLYQEYGAPKYVPNAMLKQYVRSGKWGRKAGIGVYNYKQRSTK